MFTMNLVLIWNREERLFITSQMRRQVYRISSVCLSSSLSVNIVKADLFDILSLASLSLALGVLLRWKLG